jgi:glycine amidinotransferase
MLVIEKTRAGHATALRSTAVSCHTEWQPLEEVIVGVASGSAIPAESDRMIRATMPAEWHDFFRTKGGQPFPADLIAAAQSELDHLASVLTGLGVRVRRPEAVDWAGRGGHTSAMPRDCLFVAGSSVIEAPMVWRSRQHETTAYREMLAGYGRGGATWVSAPRTDPGLLEAASGPWAINDVAPAFDAADFVRVGRDIVGQLSNVTNPSGVAWLRSFLGDDYRITLVESDPHAMHIDATVMPLRPGVVMVNPLRAPDHILAHTVFADWERIVVPAPRPQGAVPRYMTSGWINMNVLSVDEERVIIEAGDVELGRLLERRGFHVLPIPFQHVNAIGGSVHCATLDVRRAGTLESYA